MGSSKDWSTIETKCACRAYIGASEDPFAGAGKKREKFYKQIETAYTAFLEEAKQKDEALVTFTLTASTIAQRYKKARCECITFEGIVMAMKEKKPTGLPTEEDIFRATTAVYNGKGNMSNMYSHLRDTSLEYGDKFEFFDVLFFFRKSNQWELVMMSKKQEKQEVTKDKSEAKSSVQHDVGSIIGDPSDRQTNTSPIVSANEGSGVKKGSMVGSKRAQIMANQVKALQRGAEGIEELARAEKKRNVVAEQFLAVEKQRSLFTLFSLPEVNETVRRKYIKAMAQKAIEEVESSVKVGSQRKNSIGSRSDCYPNSSSFMQPEHSDLNIQESSTPKENEAVGAIVSMFGTRRSTPDVSDLSDAQKSM
ncbi:hypothetical protein BWQ96_07850 [Gracilariopsis chorda]|uniref:No apical meristem-associated C-terminal domain-containing protein n=1 Tax=Gracilariopsis chorda TaxID=448386 RepID=A0A2V3IK31_9FLOR|nr:hypothetical protein BWQ96_07850 [Gracilariopsis chorda]|eukprot:PXF42409.1 hypothetical protein BWQ96_07850 [Gracilariopsis chorda]